MTAASRVLLELGSVDGPGFRPERELPARVGVLARIMGVLVRLVGVFARFVGVTCGLEVLPLFAGRLAAAAGELDLDEAALVGLDPLLSL